jgi:hypothetical protein
LKNKSKNIIQMFKVVGQAETNAGICKNADGYSVCPFFAKPNVVCCLKSNGT